MGFVEGATSLVITIGLGTLLVWGFLEGRSEVEREAERERPVSIRLARYGAFPSDFSKEGVAIQPPRAWQSKAPP
jgi:hypothetical protein